MPCRTFVVAALASCLVAGAALATGTAVSQKGKSFSPDDVSEAAGHMLRIDNDDDVTHNITVILPDGTQRNLGVQKPGEAVEVALEKPGEVMVRCGIHPKM